MRQPVCVNYQKGHYLIFVVCLSRSFLFSRTQKAIRHVCPLRIHAMYSARLPDKKLKIQEIRIFSSPQSVPKEKGKLTLCMNHLVYLRGHHISSVELRRRNLSSYLIFIFFI